MLSIIAKFMKMLVIAVILYLMVLYSLEYWMTRSRIDFFGLKNSQIYRNSLATKDDEANCKENGIGMTGGFCLDEDNILVGNNFAWGPRFASGLEKVYKNSSVADFGAGLGNYGRYFLRKKEKIFPSKFMLAEEFLFFNFAREVLNTPKIISHYEGYDGALNIDKVTSGFIKHIDLSVPQDIGRKFDWVMTIEVGEHIPKEYETIFISNLVRHACRGIILTWAIKGQIGHYHVNNHDNPYVRQMMNEKGWITCTLIENYLRGIADIPIFKNTTMVFVPKNMLPTPCPRYEPLLCE